MFRFTIRRRTLATSTRADLWQVIKPSPLSVRVPEAGTTLYQFSSNLRAGRGLTARLTYVLQKSLSINGSDPTSGGQTQSANPLDLNGEKAEDGARHRFRAFYVYDLPFFARSTSFIGRVLGGWQASGTISARSGSPLNVIIGEDWNLDGIADDRPDLSGPIVYTRGELDETNERYFDSTAFARPTNRAVFGTLGRNAIWGPGSWGTTFAMIKNVQIAEGKRIQLRGEAYNLFNHPTLNNPNTTLNSPEFGRITGRSGNRTIQIGVKLYF